MVFRLPTATVKYKHTGSGLTFAMRTLKFTFPGPVGLMHKAPGGVRAGRFRGERGAGERGWQDRWMVKEGAPRRLRKAGGGGDRGTAPRQAKSWAPSSAGQSLGLRLKFSE